MDNQAKLARLKKACVKGRVDFDMMIEECRTGESQFHDVPEACCVTTILVSDAGRACYVTAGAGTLAGIKELVPVVEKFAKEQGCDCIRLSGRPGFVAVFKELSGARAKIVGVVIQMKLEDN